MQRYLLLFALLFFLAACTSDSAASGVAEKNFFDLRGYIDGEVARLTAAKVRVNKTITLNGVTETKALDEVNFANDLRLFREADINKPAWQEKYATEKETLSGGHEVITYLAQDSNLIVRRLLVEADQGATVRIELERKTGTILSDGVHQLTYLPATGYSVETKQQNRFGEDVDAFIEVVWR